MNRRRQTFSSTTMMMFAIGAAACADRPPVTASDNGGSGGTGEHQATGGRPGGAGGNAGSAQTSRDAAAEPVDTLARDSGTDQAAADSCESSSLCESFETYGATKAIADKQTLGPWRAALTKGATMELSAKHTFSGTNALHVHIDNAVTAGGRLFVTASPLLASKPTHVYGRMMMYIEANGSSVHWTFFGANGPALPNSPVAGRGASYLLSSLPKNGVNTYAFVYGLAAKGTDSYHDCWAQSSTPMPPAWSCVSFEMDSAGRNLRMYKDTAANRILSVQDHGDGCVAPTAGASPWYGPAMNELYVGAWSFHSMNAPLDVWIDDLVVSEKHMSCVPL